MPRNIESVGAEGTALRGENSAAPASMSPAPPCVPEPRALRGKLGDLEGVGAARHVGRAHALHPDRGGVLANVHHLHRGHDLRNRDHAVALLAGSPADLEYVTQRDPVVLALVEEEYDAATLELAAPRPPDDAGLNAVGDG